MTEQPSLQRQLGELADYFERLAGELAEDAPGTDAAFIARGAGEAAFRHCAERLRALDQPVEEREACPTCGGRLLHYLGCTYGLPIQPVSDQPGI